jgi:hypothetical protein
MITIGKHILVQNTLMLVVWDLVNLRQFDHINQMKSLAVITSSAFTVLQFQPHLNFFSWFTIGRVILVGLYFSMRNNWIPFWLEFCHWVTYMEVFDFVKEADSFSQNLTCLRIFYVEGFELRQLKDKKGVICHWSIWFTFVQFWSI